MNHLEQFEQHRSLLFSLAYRMLSSVSDAEDMVQEAFLRWQQVPEATVRLPKTYLSSIVTRLCIDHLRSARVQREQYVGTWLPEPLVTQSTTDPIEVAELADSLSIAFLVMLERLSPTERAVLLLRKVFDYSYADIGQILHKGEVNCRQILRRAKQKLTSKAFDLNMPLQQQEELTEQFLQTWMQADMQSLLTLVAEGATFWADGGGKVVAAVNPLYGARKIVRFLIATRHSKVLPDVTSQRIYMNGQPGIINSVNGHLHSVFSFEFANGHIQSIFAVVNPDKLQQILERQPRLEI
ncbi:MAG: RNA polymerase sigma-70 factor [Symplocastrum torsivum CPER-KK1]|jgi:RNA polymerase sigma-70 factor (ECF subfamily)|uniref:RNA polymerase sigma-70 factor n=1 Tax=Symplocastrum torsivum CPER-KK1 TaxID=450513 RepID=A0A951PGL0_9CYAN|nr:RNA polymerase sigma-70 factor [Symplocastrum torsivum CPER-KK1]